MKTLNTFFFALISCFALFCFQNTSASESTPSKPVSPKYQQNFHDYLDLPGLYVSSYASNNSQNQANANFYFRAEQGVNKRYYQFEDCSTGFTNWNDSTNEFGFYGNIRLLLLTNYPENPKVNLHQSKHLNLFGLELDTQMNIENDSLTYYYPEKDEWIWMENDSIIGNYSFNISPALIKSINMNLNDWESKYYDWETETILSNHYLEISFNGQGIFTGTDLQKQVFSSQFTSVPSTPEPGSLLLLGAGALGILRRRRN